MDDASVYRMAVRLRAQLVCTSDTRSFGTTQNRDLLGRWNITPLFREGLYFCQVLVIDADQVQRGGVQVVDVPLDHSSVSQNKDVSPDIANCPGTSDDSADSHSTIRRSRWILF